MSAFVNGCISATIGILTATIPQQTYNLINRKGTYNNMEANRRHDLLKFTCMIAVGGSLLIGSQLADSANLPQLAVMLRGISLGALGIIGYNVSKYHYLLPKYTSVITMSIALCGLCAFSIYKL